MGTYVRRWIGTVEYSTRPSCPRYGFTGNPILGAQVPQIMPRTVIVPTHNRTYCSTTYPSTYGNFSNQFHTCQGAMKCSGWYVSETDCAYTGNLAGGQDVCNGDSGSGVRTVANDSNVVLSTVSWSIQCALPKRPCAVHVWLTITR